MSTTFHLGAGGAILAALAFVLVGLGLWYASIQFNKPGLKTVGILIGAFPIVGFGLQIAASYFGWGEPTDNYRTSVAGTAHSEKTATREFPMYFSNPEIPHSIEFTPKAYLGENALGDVTLSFELRTPKGEIATSGGGTVAPDPHKDGDGKNDRWQIFRASFEPPVEGSYTMKLVMPNPVGGVDIEVKELKK